MLFDKVWDDCEPMFMNRRHYFFISSSYIRVRLGELYTNVCYLKGVHTPENKISVFAKKRMVAVITLDLFFISCH